MDGGGFEPPKHNAADLQSVPFGHSGIHPYSIDIMKAVICFQHHESYYNTSVSLCQADRGTRTLNLLITNQLLCQLSHIGTFLYQRNDPNGNRTRVTAVKGRCLNRLTMGPVSTPRVGLEPTTPRLTAVCSTIELSRIIL